MKVQFNAEKHRQDIENGKLKVYAKGSFANYFNRIEASEEEKIRKRSSKKKKSV